MKTSGRMTPGRQNQGEYKTVISSYIRISDLKKLAVDPDDEFNSWQGMYHAMCCPLPIRGKY